MSTSQDFDEQIRAAARDVLAISPLISERQMSTALSKKFNQVIGRTLIRRVMRKASREAQENVDRAKIVPQITAMAEMMRMGIDRMNKILFSDTSDTEDKDRIAAFKAITAAHRTLIVVMTDAGIFAKQPDQVKVEHVLEVSDEIKAIMANAERWGFLGDVPKEPETETDAPVMVDAALMELPNGQPTEKPAEPKIFRSGAVDSHKQAMLDDIAAQQREDAAARGTAVAEQNGDR